MFGKVITNVIMFTGGVAVGQGFFAYHPKVSTTIVIIGFCVFFVGVVFRGLTEKR